MGEWEIHYNLPVEFYGHTPTCLLKFNVVTLRYACVTTYHFNTTHYHTPRKINPLLLATARNCPYSYDNLN